MVVVSHQTPGINRPGIELLDLLYDVEKMEGLRPVVENKLSPGDSAIDMVSGSGKKQARFSRHGMPPMRGRDVHILPGPSHNSTIRYVAPMIS